MKSTLKNHTKIYFIMRILILSTLIYLVIMSFGCDMAAEEKEEPVDPSIVDARRTAIFNYISNLSNADSFQGVISGQNAYHGSQITDSDYAQGYKTMVKDLYTETGEWVGILGVDYEYQQCYRPAQLVAANAVLIDYAKEGGIIAITFSPQNPWSYDETDLSTADGNIDYNGTRIMITADASMDDLLDESKAVHAAWMRKLNRIGSALQELRDAGVIVLFRPMQEMNGNWFWWGMSSHPDDDGAAYGRVYRHMKEYFSNDLGLNNLIWVYSPCESHGLTFNNTATWIRSVDWAYPGDADVDIVAGTSYTEDMSIDDYDTYLSLGKPLGMGEYGPRQDENTGEFPTLWDNSQIATKIADEYPRIAFWVSWHWKWSLIENNNSTELLQNPQVINRDDFDWTVTQELLPQVGTNN